MKKLTILTTFTLCCLCKMCFGQVAGVQTDMFNAFNATTIDPGSMELEPTYSYARALGFFDQAGDYQDYAGIEIFSALTFRVAYGINENWEVGANVSTAFNQLSISTKYHLLGNNKFGLGLLGGINSDITNGPRALSSLNRQYILGLASHYHFSEVFFINTSFQYQDGQDYIGNDYFLNSEVAFYISDELMLIAGLGLSSFSNSELTNANVLSLFPGFNLEKRMFNIALQGQFDLLGKNINSSTGISISITQLLN